MLDRLFIENIAEKNEKFCLLKDGKLLKGYNPTISDDEVLEAYKWMLRSRTQEEIMTKYQRQGRLLSFISSEGQEAIEVGTTLNLRKGKDWFVPAFRANVANQVLGKNFRTLVKYWNGSEDGSNVPKDVRVLPINIPIATQYSHASGIIFASKLRGDEEIALTYIGDGGTSEGEFYEALNFAKVHELGVIFCVINNQFAISTRKEDQTHSLNFAIKGVAAGVEGIIVDGNDFFAVYEATKIVVERAKQNIPTLIEFVTYRLGPHSSADDPKIYRTEEEVRENMENCPIKRLREYLVLQKLWNKEMENEFKTQVEEDSKAILNEEFDTLKVSIDDIFDHTYANLTENLKEQKEIAKKYFTNKEN